MGREIKRVALNFDWFHGKGAKWRPWEGYINPHQSEKCPDCDGSGLAPRAKELSDQWYGNAYFDPITYGAVPLTMDNPTLQAFARRNVERSPEYYGPMSECAVRREAHRLFSHWHGQWAHHLIQADVDALIEAGRLMDFTHTPRTAEQREIVRKKIADGGNSWLPESNRYRPTAEEVNDWSLCGMGHDAINQHVCVEARCKREGASYTCEACGGDGDYWASPDLKAAHDAWEPTEPPAGDGWQLWETVSEGSPVSPVSATAEELIDWMALNGDGNFPVTRAAAEAFVKAGWAPSMISTPEHGLQTGVEACGNKK